MQEPPYMKKMKDISNKLKLAFKSRPLSKKIIAIHNAIANLNKV